METEGGGESQTPPQNPLRSDHPCSGGRSGPELLGADDGLNAAHFRVDRRTFWGRIHRLRPILFAPRFALHSRPLGALSLIGAIMAACFQANEGFFAIVLICAVCIGLVTWGADRVLWVRKILKQRCRN